MVLASYNKKVKIQLDELGYENEIEVTTSPTTSGDITITLTPYEEVAEDFVVAVLDTDSTSEVATAIASEIDDDLDWNASSEGEVVTIDNADNLKFSISFEDTGSTGTEVDINYEWQDIPANEANLNFNTDMLDDTILGNNMRSRLSGLIEWDVSMTVLYDKDENIVSDLRSAFTNRDQLRVRYLPDGSSGYEGDCVIETFDLSGGVDDLESADVNLLSAGELETYEEVS